MQKSIFKALQQLSPFSCQVRTGGKRLLVRYFWTVPHDLREYYLDSDLLLLLSY